MRVAYEDVKSWDEMLGGDLDLVTWRRRRLPAFINVEQLERDWRDYFHGNRDLKSFSARYCFENLLKPLTTGYDREPNRIERNAQALSDALREMLPEELYKYRREREAEASAQVRAHEWVPQTVAAKFLGCSDRWVRELVRSGELQKHPKTGKIKSSSLLRYRSRT